MLGLSSCVQGTDAAPEAEEPGVAALTPREIEAHEDGNLGRAGGDIVVGDPFTYRICVLLRGGPTSARVAFCVSQPQGDVRGRCFSHLHDGPVSWSNWCYSEFVE